MPGGWGSGFGCVVRAIARAMGHTGLFRLHVSLIDRESQDDSSTASPQRKEENPKPNPEDSARSTCSSETRAFGFAKFVEKQL